MLSATASSSFDLETFNRHGYIVIPDFLSPETLILLRERVVQLLQEFEPEGHPLTKFSTGEKEAHIGDEVSSLVPILLFQYFLTSGNKVRYFLEEEAVDTSGKLLKPKDRCINKIGHGIL
jgi:phytanoyl-CoA hydroxylase